MGHTLGFIVLLFTETDKLRTEFILNTLTDLYMLHQFLSD